MTVNIPFWLEQGRRRETGCSDVYMIVLDVGGLGCLPYAVDGRLCLFVLFKIEIN